MATSFPFAKLPRELRDMIYELLASDPVGAYASTKRGKVCHQSAGSGRKGTAECDCFRICARSRVCLKAIEFALPTINLLRLDQATRREYTTALSKHGCVKIELVNTFPRRQPTYIQNWPSVCCNFVVLSSACNDVDHAPSVFVESFLLDFHAFVRKTLSEDAYGKAYPKTIRGELAVKLDIEDSLSKFAESENWKISLEYMFEMFECCSVDMPSSLHAKVPEDVKVSIIILVYLEGFPGEAHGIFEYNLPSYTTADHQNGEYEMSVVKDFRETDTFESIDRFADPQVVCFSHDSEDLHDGFDDQERGNEAFTEAEYGFSESEGSEKAEAKSTGSDIEV